MLQSPVNPDKKMKVKLPRSHVTDFDAPIEIPVFVPNMRGKVFYKRYPTNDSWSEADLVSDGRKLTFNLPKQPPAGKLTYYLKLRIDRQEVMVSSPEDPIIIRFKGHVPTGVLAPHIFFMFFSMLIAVLAATEALLGGKIFRRLGFITTGCLVVGGLILGPIVQKYAFGVYWAGFPYDWDLTDNKLLVGVIFWVMATILNLKKENKAAVVVASLVLIGVYSIPHSMKGSEFNYEAGRVETTKGY